MPFPSKNGGQVLGLFSRAAINNAAFTFVPADKVYELTAAYRFSRAWQGGRFGLSKPWTKTSGVRTKRRLRMSPRVAASAVAVSAKIWTPGSEAANLSEVEVVGAGNHAPTETRSGPRR